MSRLTRKKYDGETLYGSPIGIKCDDFDQLQNVYNKLGKLEDLEDELGFPLEVVFKAIEQDEIYVKFFDEIQHWSPIKIDLRNKKIWYSKQVGGHYALQQPLNKYGIGWWLKGDRSQ